jgi:hypothetical protein
VIRAAGGTTSRSEKLNAATVKFRQASKSECDYRSDGVRDSHMRYPVIP